MSILPPLLRKHSAGPIIQWSVCLGIPIAPFLIALTSIWRGEPTFEGRVTLTIWASIGAVIVAATLLALAQPWSRENWQ